jgi:iron-sulfur cluster assembly protein
MTNPRLISITNTALNEVKRLLEDEAPECGLRLGIKGGGCSGLSYALEFTEHKEGDTVLDWKGITVYLDRKSTVYLSGITLDYKDGLDGRGFIFYNPHATNTCGCGESFSM